MLPSVALAVAGVALWGVSLRLTDAHASETIPAEDPYTHLALTREHLRDGSLDGLNGPDDKPYPPGLHALLASAHVHSGVPLETLVRFGPMAFGAVTVLGVAYALWRLDGPVAAVVGAVAAAVTPELVFRQQMMAPTVLDLAILPFALLALAELARGRLGWAVPAAALLAFLVASHPWIFGLLALAGAGFLLLALAFPWAGRPSLDARGLALAALLLGGSSALAVSGCWGTCGPGFDVVDHASEQRFDAAAAALGIGTLLLAGGMALGRRRVQRGLDALRPVGPAVATLGSITLVAAAAATLWIAEEGGLPEQVHLRSMLGAGLMAVAAAGLAATPWARGPGAHVAAGLVAATLPFTVFDPFDSPFWPHRTAAYLAIGLALAAGVAAGALARLVLAGAAASAPASAQKEPGPRPGAMLRRAVPAAVVALVLAAGLVSAAPAQYPPWYRLHDECESDALRDIAALAAANPDLVVVAGAWQPKLVLAGTAPDATRLWYLGDALTSSRQAALATFADDTGRPVLIVVERHALDAARAPALPSSPAWSLDQSWDCATPVTTHLHTPT